MAAALSEHNPEHSSAANWAFVTISSQRRLRDLAPGSIASPMPKLPDDMSAAAVAKRAVASAKMKVETAGKLAASAAAAGPPKPRIAKKR